MDENKIKEAAALIAKMSDDGVPQEEIQKFFERKGINFEELTNSINNMPTSNGDEVDEQPQTHEEKISKRNEENSNKYKGIWDEAINKLDDTLPVVHDAEILADAYQKLIKEKNRLTGKLDSGNGLSKADFDAQMKPINDALKAAEESPEFEALIDRLRDTNLSYFQDERNQKTASLLRDMAMHKGSDSAGEYGKSFSNWLYGDVANTGFARWKNTHSAGTDTDYIPGGENGHDFSKGYGLKNVPKYYDKYNFKEINNLPENNVKSTGGSSNITDKNVTDNMKFGSDVQSEKYVQDRNNALAIHLKEKGITDKEEIDKYLAQYGAWENAKPERKEKTLNELSKKLEKYKKENNTEKENNIKEDKGNEELMSKLPYKWENKYDISKAWMPDMSSPLNGEDEEFIYDNQGNKIGSKAPKKEKTKTEEKPKSKETNNTDKNSKSNEKPKTEKKSKTEENSKKNTNSKVIMGLLNSAAKGIISGVKNSKKKDNRNEIEKILDTIE